MRASLASNVGVVTGASFRSRSFLEEPAAFFPCAIAMMGGVYTTQKEARDG
jgi:hypothetical protein